jgi:hypothetical protein
MEAYEVYPHHSPGSLIQCVDWVVDLAHPPCARTWTAKWSPVASVAVKAEAKTLASMVVVVAAVEVEAAPSLLPPGARSAADSLIATPSALTSTLEWSPHLHAPSSSSSSTHQFPPPSSPRIVVSSWAPGWERLL